MRAVLVWFIGCVLAGCQCARLDDGLDFRCETQTDCAGSETCVDGRCVSAAAGGSNAGGAPGGGSTAGGSAAGGSAAGGNTAGGNTAGGNTAGGNTAGGNTAGGSTAGGASGDAGCNLQPDPVDDLFLDSNCDGIDGVADGGLFVDGVNGSDTPAGRGTTRADPLRTVSMALGLVRGSRPNTHSIFIVGTDYPEQVVWDRNVSLYGGYTTNGFARTGVRARLTNPDGGVTLEIRNGLLPSTRLDSVDVRAENAAAGASVAVRIVSASPSLTHLHISQGRGADGVGGASGVPGAAGSPGGPGDAGVVNGLLPIRATAAVTGACNSGNPGGNGGAGGFPAAAGQQPGFGGAPGNDQGISCLMCECTFGINPLQDGNPGAPGRDGDAGVNGAGGDGIGFIAGIDWRPRLAAMGTAGQHGEPGHGGGGGGMLQGTFDQGAAMLTQRITGSAGGGGGTGGCGGLPGGAGTGGGASIGMLLVGNSNPTLGDVSITAARGGNGGSGAQGGMGNTGGAGAPGGARVYADCVGNGALAPSNLAATEFYGGAGGTGGTGGRGGRGGLGGGGGGGPSIGVWCQDAGFLGPNPVVVGLQGGTMGSPNGAAGVTAPRYGCP